MKKFYLVLVIVVLVVIVYVSAGQWGTRSKSGEPAGGAVTATAPNAAIFDPMTLKKGDTVGSFVVVAVGPAKEGHTLSANDASVRFTMNVSIKGTYRVVNGYDVVDPLSPEVAKMLPHQANDPLELQSSTCIEYPAIKNLNLHEGDAVVGVAKEVAYVSYPSSGCRYTMSLQSLEKAKN